MLTFLRMTRSIVALACVLLPATVNAAEPQRWAILIGVNDYVQLEDLRFASEDADALARGLAGAGFPEKQIFLVKDGAKETKYLPIKSNIERQLDLVLNLVGKDDLVLVAFSGHGMHLDGKSYLCPTEANVDNPAASMIAVDDVYARLAKSPAAMKLIVLDACRNDPRPAGKKSATPQEDAQKLSASFERPPDGIWLLASCGAGQVSYEDQDLKHGVFMSYLLDGLGGKADGNKNGKISLGELYEFASQETKLHVARKWTDFQVPAQKGELNGVFEFVPSGPVAGQVITNTIGMKLVAIPAGQFEMGTSETNAELLARFPDAKAEYFEDERPAHTVRITKPFYLGQHEVTVGQFRQFVTSAGYQTESERDGEGGYGYNAAKNELEGRKPQYTWKNTGFTQTDDHPVVNVTWNDAFAFCQWLSRKEGKTYRLPTEAEWEYACRAGTKSLYYHGDDPEGLALVGNVADGTAKTKFSTWSWTIQARDGYVFTAPVGRFKPNAFGLYDMHGNVWEWCQDWYGAKYYDALGGRITEDPTGDMSEKKACVLRGASWGNPPRNIRSALRYGNSPDNRDDDRGFRVARTE